MEVTVFDELVQADTAVFRQPDIDARTRTLKHGQKVSQDALYRLRRCPDVQDAGHATRQRPRTLDERLRLYEDVAAPREQVLAGGRQLDATADPIEEPDAEFGLEILDLAGECGLADVHAQRRLRDAAHLGDTHEVAQMPEL